MDDKRLPVTFYIDGDASEQWEGPLDHLQVGQGIIWADEKVYRIKDIWTSFDKHRHDFGSGIHVFLEPSATYPGQEKSRPEGRPSPDSH